MLIIFTTICLSILSAILYRMGGSDRFNTKWRDLGVPLCTLVALILCSGFNSALWLAYVLSYILLFVSMTTYWKKKGTSAKWYNWMFVGLGFSLAMLPFAIGDGSWGIFALRAVVLTIGITLWSQFISNPMWEECGRGFLAVVTILLYLLKKKKEK